MNRILFTIYFGIYLTCNISAQKINKSYIFGNSLVHHEFQVNPTPSQETSVPHWLHFLSEANNHNYEVSGQYGFLPQHAQLPPISNWSFDYALNAWDSDNESFGIADFTNIIITPGNFIQWQAPNENYPMESFSPVSTTIDIINWSILQEQSITAYIYEGWPDMSPFLNNGFPPSNEEWLEYDQYMNNEFHNWYIEYVELLHQSVEPDCLKLIPVGSLLSTLFKTPPFNEIPISDLYEDDAPHGKSTLYFLAALITYMTTYEEIAPVNYQVDPIIHPIVAENYEGVINLFWSELQNMNNDQGNSQVFCNNVSSNTSINITNNNKVTITPNPFINHLKIINSQKLHSIDIVSLNGERIFKSILNVDNTIDLSHLKKGVFALQGKDENGEILFTEKIVKI